MTSYTMNDMSYRSLNNDNEANVKRNHHEVEHDENTALIIHVVQENRGGWTHIEDLDSFFARMYQYYLKGGFLPMVVAECFQLLQHTFIILFVTFLIYCVNYPVLFSNDMNNPSVKAHNVTFADIVYPNCIDRISFSWWVVLFICSLVGIFKMARCSYNLYHACDIKMFYNNALGIQEEDITWICWSTVLGRVKKAQQRLQMCIHKDQINELDVYQRILRFNNYMIAMLNKNILPLHLNFPGLGNIPFLSKGLKYNLELVLFYSPWSPWENCWHLRDSFKDPSKRLLHAQELRRLFTSLTLLNILLFPLIQAWQILYFFFNYAELIKRSPGSLGLRTWSLYSQISLRHFNELDHELQDRLHRAYKPATKYLNSLSDPISTVIAKNIAFFSASILGVLILLSLYNEVVLTVEHMLTLMTGLGVLVACARAFMHEEGECQQTSEELLVQILGHVHYLPSNWRGKAHTRTVATHFKNLFQFRFMYLLMELISPIVTPYMLYKMRNHSLDIIDFYRNFTVTVLGIGDVCSFAQMDIKHHGNADWPANRINEDSAKSECNELQLNQAEDGKTELSLVAFSCRNPTWRMPHASQRRYIQSLREGVLNATNNYISGNHSTFNQMNKSFLNSYYDRYNTGITPEMSIRHRSRIFNATDEENIEEEVAKEEEMVDKVESQTQEELEMSVGTLHLHDLHLNKMLQRSRRSSESFSHTQSHPHQSTSFASYQPTTSTPPAPSKEDTPLLPKRHK